MAHRKEVFQSKVFQRLYPAAPKLEKDPSPPRIVEALAKKTHVKRKASQGDTANRDAGMIQSASNPGRRMYTVLPPPADYKTDAEKSVTLPQLENINSAENPAEEINHESNEDLEDEAEEEQKRRRRRRKRKPTSLENSGKDGAAQISKTCTGEGQTSMDEGAERISRNKKRKLKKKRHKEKLLSLGLMPRASALEFTYQKDGEEEEEDDDDDEEGRAAEVSDFLRTTLEIYMSDSLLHEKKLLLQSGMVDNLLSSITSRNKPDSLLKQLYSLKAFVKKKDTDRLAKALEELHNNSSLSVEETTAVVSLFQYWITDILPMQGNKKTEEFSTTHP